MIGTTVVLYEKTMTGVDEFNNPVYSVTQTTVNNVLVGQPETDDIAAAIDLYGKQITYMLGLPKGDEHNWTDTIVEIFGKPYRTFGDVIQGIEENVPTPWHKKVRVERFG